MTSPASSPTSDDAHVEERADKLALMAAACRTILECLGEDPARDGLVKTPMRMAKALLSCTSGYAEDARGVVADALFECESNELVLVRGVDVFSLCEHHMLPFYGKAHVAYLPTGRVVGACVVRARARVRDVAPCVRDEAPCVRAPCVRSPCVCAPCVRASSAAQVVGGRL